MFVIAKRKSCGVEHMLWVAKCVWVAGAWVGVAIKGQWLYWDQDVPAMIGLAQSSSGTIRLRWKCFALGILINTKSQIQGGRYSLEERGWQN